MHLLHLSDSRSFRIVWAIEEMGLSDKVEVHGFKRIGGKRAPSDMAESLKLSVKIPNKAPSLVDGDLVVLESANILEYLAERYANDFLPPTSQWRERTTVLQWLQFTESTLMSVSIHHVAHSRRMHTMPIVYGRWTFEEGDGAEKMNATMQGNVDADLGFVEQQLGQTKAFIAGDKLSIADLQLAWTLVYLAAKKVGVSDFSKYPNIDKYLQHIVERPAYKKAASDGLMTLKYPA